MGTLPTQETLHLIEVNSELEADVFALQKECLKLKKELISDGKDFKTSIAQTEVKCTCKLSESNSSSDLNIVKKSHCSTLSLNIQPDRASQSCICKNCTCNNCYNISQNHVDFINLSPKIVSGHDICLQSCNINLPCDLEEKLNMTNMGNLPISTEIPIENSNSLCNEATSTSAKMTSVADFDLNNLNSTFPYKAIKTFNHECKAYQSVSDLASDLFLDIRLLLDGLAKNTDDCTESKSIFSFPHFRALIDSLESILFAENKSRLENEIHVHELENYYHTIKSVASKQECLIDSLLDKIKSIITGSKNAHETICLLRNRLQSYGLLKIQNNHTSGINAMSAEKSIVDFCGECDSTGEMASIFEDINSTESINPLNVFKASFMKLNSFNNHVFTLQSLLSLLHDLADSLIAGVQSHELRVKGTTNELKEAHHLLSVMREQHQKLQSAQNIVRYDLQEKRKLLTKLKQELETTREDSNLVRAKNSNSEVKWQTLRKEFAQRNKQASEESGFMDDKGLEDQDFNPSVNEHNSENAPKTDQLLVNESICEVKNEFKKSRLEILEKQCQLLCSSLVNSSIKGQELDCRLNLLCNGIEKGCGEFTESLDDPLPIQAECRGNQFERKIPIYSCNELNDFLPSSDIKNPGSEHLYDKHNISTKLSTDFVPKSIKILHLNQNITNLEENQTCPRNLDTLYNEPSDFNTSIPQTEKGAFSECLETCAGFNFPDVRNYLKHEPQEKSYDSTQSPVIESENPYKQISKLQEDKEILELKLLAIDKTLEETSRKLTETDEKLKFTISEKVQEVASFKHQLNSEALKYENALKDFKENNKCLNDMKQRITDQEQLILILEEALSEIQLERQKEKENQWVELQDIQLALVAREDECLTLSTDLEQSLISTEETENKNKYLLNQLENIQAYTLKDRQAMCDEILLLQNDNKELKKKSIKLLKEKDVLWKRNYFLTYLHNVKVDDRWMEDREVSKCLGCNTQFTFLLRKHHCRQCGRIFCNTCSNNWLLTSFSRKQIRVCNECYSQYLMTKQDIRRGTILPCFENDSGDEDIVDDMELNHFITDTSSSISNSTASLPIFEENGLKNRKAHCTSAPDLHTLEALRATKHSKLEVTNQVQAIKSNAFGELLIKEEEEAVLPIWHESSTSELHWWVSSDSETIPVFLIYENCHTNYQPSVLHQSECESEGIVQLSNAGIYKFHFNNKSRLTPISVKYTLTKKYFEENIAS